MTASSPYPEDAARFVNAVMHACQQRHVNTRLLGVADTLNELNTHLNGHREELERTRQRLRHFEERRDVAAGSSVGVVSERFELLKQKFVKARLAAEEAKFYYEGLQRPETEPNKFRQFAQTYGNHTPGIAAPKVEAEEGTAGSDEAFVQKPLSLAKALVEDARIREKQLAEVYAQEFAKTRVSGKAGSEYKDRVSECEMLENLCNSCLRGITELKIQIPSGLKIHVLEWAVPASKPSRPNRARIMKFAALAGLVTDRETADLA